MTIRLRRFYIATIVFAALCGIALPLHLISPLIGWTLLFGSLALGNLICGRTFTLAVLFVSIMSGFLPLCQHYYGRGLDDGLYTLAWLVTGIAGSAYAFMVAANCCEQPAIPSRVRRAAAETPRETANAPNPATLRPI